MAYQQRRDDNVYAQRQMFKGNWTCSKCGAAITELPFEPNPERLDQLLCKNCHREKRNSGERNFQSRGDRPRFEGNWTCSKCGKEITSLPFEPDPARVNQLFCYDCNKERRSRRF